MICRTSACSNFSRKKIKAAVVAKSPKSTWEATNYKPGFDMTVWQEDLWRLFCSPFTRFTTILSNFGAIWEPFLIRLVSTLFRFTVDREKGYFMTLHYEFLSIPWLINLSSMPLWQLNQAFGTRLGNYTSYIGVLTNSFSLLLDKCKHNGINTTTDLRCSAELLTVPFLWNCLFLLANLSSLWVKDK